MENHDQYASGLSQYRFDAFGGFAIEEVESEINRGTKLRCFICKGEKAKGKRVTGAVCGCAVKSCRKTFHFVCAHEDDQSVTKRLVISRSKNKRKFVLYRVFCSSAHEVLFRSTLKDLRKQKKFENTSSEDNSDVSSQPTLNLSISGHETSYIDSPLVNGSFAPKTFVPADISVVKNSAESFTSPVNKDSVLVNHKTPDSTAEESKENTVENMRTSNSHTSDRRRSNNFGKARHSIARVSFPPGCSPLLEADESDKESEPDIPNETTESFLETLGQKSPQLIIEDINLNCPVNFDQDSSTPPENIPAQKEQTVSEASAKSPGSSRSPKSQTMTQSQQIESLDKTVTLAQKKEKSIVLRTSPRKSLVSSHTVTNVPARIVVVADVHIRSVVDADGVNEEPSMKKSSTLEVLNPTEPIKPSPAKGLSQRNVGQGELNSDHSKDDLNPRDSISASANDVSLLAVIGEMETEITSTVDITAPTHIKEMVNSSPAKVTHPGSPDIGLSRRGRPPKRKRSPLSRQEDGIGKKVEETKRKFDNCLDEAIVLLFPSDVEKFRKAEERFMALASAEMNTDLSKIFVWQYLMPITLKPYLNVFIIHEVIKSVGESVDRSSLEELLFNRETVQKNVEIYKQQFFEGLQDDKVEEELATVFWSSLARKIEYLFPAGTNKHQIARILHLGDESILALNLSILDNNHSLCALLKAQTGLYRWTENTTPATFPQLSIDARHRATTFECLILQTWFTKVTHVMDTVSLPQDPQMLDEAALTSNKILTNFVNSLEVSINASKSNFTETDSRQETNPEFPLLLIFKPIDFEVVNFQQYFQKVVRNALVERQVPRVLALLPTTNLHTVSGQTVLELVSNNYIISGDNLLVKMWSVFRPEDHPTSLVLVEISRQEAHGVKKEDTSSSESSSEDEKIPKKDHSSLKAATSVRTSLNAQAVIKEKSSSSSDSSLEEEASKDTSMVPSAKIPERNTSAVKRKLSSSSSDTSTDEEKLLTTPQNSVLQLSDEELEKRVLMLQKDLRAVYTGKLHSQRHVQYMEGGNRRRLLDKQVHLQLFCEGHEDVVMDALLKIFPNSQYRNLDYLMRVMLPEALMRIYKQVTGFSWEKRL